MCNNTKHPTTKECRPLFRNAWTWRHTTTKFAQITAEYKNLDLFGPNTGTQPFSVPQRCDPAACAVCNHSARR